MSLVLKAFVGGLQVRHWGPVLALFGLAMASPVAAQTTLYWDRANGAGAGSGATLNGTWDTATSNNWDATATGTGGRVTYISGSDAVFSSGTSAVGQTYTITVSGTQSASSISIEEGTVTFSGGTAINLSDATPDFTVASGLTANVSTDLTGTNGLTKVGAGTLTLNTSDKSYTGTTTISAGTLDLAFNQNLSTVALAGGTLKLSTATNNITDLNITANSTIDFGGANATINVTNFTIAGGVTLNIINWVNGADFFFATNWTGAVYNATGATPMNQVVFNSPTFTGSDTKWLPYGNHEITPLPEPSTYGALLLAAATGLIVLRRRVSLRAI